MITFGIRHPVQNNNRKMIVGCFVNTITGFFECQCAQVLSLVASLQVPTVLLSKHQSFFPQDCQYRYRDITRLKEIVRRTLL
jgi:hypothetical protein